MGNGIPLPLFFGLYKNGSPIWTAEIFAPLSFITLMILNQKIRA